MSEPDMGWGRPNSARRCNYLLGGKDNFLADQESADSLRQVVPTVFEATRETRAFRDRAVLRLATSNAVDQYLDLGCGMPHPPAIHEIVQEHQPDARMVYVDNDPMVGVHMRVWGHVPEIGVRYADADITRPQTVLQHPGITPFLDFTRPLGLVMTNVLHLFADPGDILAQYTQALAAGSRLVLTHGTVDDLPAPAREILTSHITTAADPYIPRTHAEVAALLDGWMVEPPGIVSTVRWHPDLHPRANQQLNDAQAMCYAAVAVRR